jgi:hypothetical protein
MSGKKDAEIRQGFLGIEAQQPKSLGVSLALLAFLAVRKNRYYAADFLLAE